MAQTGQLVTQALGTSQETFQLVASNVSTGPAVVAGGNYIFTQTASAYGTVAFQVLGPDGSTYMTAASYTTTDSTTGHSIALGSFAQVRVTVTGTTNANATLTRVPA